jgi:predicted dehydrogenase
VNQRIKLGLVGAGPVAERYYVPATRAVPEIRPFMVADVDLGRAQRVADLVPFEHATSRIEDLIGNVEIAIVALPNAFHQTVTCQLLEAGIHVLCEKPMARNVAECNLMIESAERGNALLCIAHNRRFRSNVGEARKLLTKGIIGQIKHIEAEEGSTSDWPRSKAYFDPKLAGGGALLDVGIHSVDLIRYLVGDFGELKYKGNETADCVESDCTLQFTLSDGPTGVLTSSRDRNLRQRIVIQGDQGELTIGLWSPLLALSLKSGKAFQQFKQLQLNPVRRASDASFVEQLLSFVKAIRNQTAVPVSGMEGLKAVEVVERAYRTPAVTSATAIPHHAAAPQASKILAANARS